MVAPAIVSTEVDSFRKVSNNETGTGNPEPPVDNNRSSDPSSPYYTPSAPDATNADVSDITGGPLSQAAKATAGYAKAVTTGEMRDAEATGYESVDAQPGAKVQANLNKTAEQATASTGRAVGAGPAATGEAQDAAARTAGPAAQGEATGYFAKNGVIDSSQTTEGRLNALLGRDSAYLRRAAHGGLLAAAQRGLGNSSFAAGAATGAAIDRAAPIAEADASRAFANQRANTDATNRASEVSTARETAIEQMNVQARNAQSQFDAQLETSNNQFNAQTRSQMSLANAQMLNSRDQFNAQSRNQMEALNSQLETAVSQGNTQQANTLRQQINALNTQIATTNSTLDQQTNLFNAQAANRAREVSTERQTRVSELNAQIAADLDKFNADSQNRISALNAQLETAVSQQNAEAQNRINSQIMQAQTEAAMYNAEAGNRMALAGFQADAAMAQQYLQGEQAADIARLQGEYQYLISTNEVAGRVYDGFFNAVAARAADPKTNASELAGIVSGLLPLLRGGLEFASGLSSTSETEEAAPGAESPGAGGGFPGAGGSAQPPGASIGGYFSGLFGGATG